MLTTPGQPSSIPFWRDKASYDSGILAPVDPPSNDKSWLEAGCVAAWTCRRLSEGKPDAS